MLRVREDGIDGARLDKAARVHDRDAIGDLGHDTEIMRHEDHGHAGLALKLGNEREYLRLDGDVERGGRLVGDQQIRPVDERHGDHYALAHAARKLMRIGIDTLLGRRNAHAAQHIERTLARRLLAAAMMAHDSLGNLVADAESRIERRHRLLEDHRETIATQIRELLARHGEQVFALEEGAAARDARRRACEQTHDGEGRDALAAARLADEAECLAAAKAEARTIDEVYAVPVEADGEIIHRKHITRRNGTTGCQINPSYPHRSGDAVSATSCRI